MLSRLSFRTVSTASCSVLTGCLARDQIITFLSLYRVLTQSLTRGLLLGFLTAVGFGCEAVGPLAQAQLNRLTKAPC